MLVQPRKQTVQSPNKQKGRSPKKQLSSGDTPAAEVDIEFSSEKQCVESSTAPTQKQSGGEDYEISKKDSPSAPQGLNGSSCSASHAHNTTPDTSSRQPANSCSECQVSDKNSRTGASQMNPSECTSVRVPLEGTQIKESEFKNEELLQHFDDAPSNKNLDVLAIGRTELMEQPRAAEKPSECHVSVSGQSNMLSENDVPSNEKLVGTSQSPARNDDSAKSTSLSGASTQSVETQSQAEAASPSLEYEVIIACLGSQIATPACAFVQTFV
jgi:hypothetical protein